MIFDPFKKVVYLHRLKKDNSIVYVGHGGPARPFRKKQRKNKKHVELLHTNDYLVEIVAHNLEFKEAQELEWFLIEEIGLDNLYNQEIKPSFDQSYNSIKVINSKGEVFDNLKIASKAYGYSRYQTFTDHFREGKLDLKKI